MIPDAGKRQRRPVRGTRQVSGGMNLEGSEGLTLGCVNEKGFADQFEQGQDTADEHQDHEDRDERAAQDCAQDHQACQLLPELVQEPSPELIVALSMRKIICIDSLSSMSPDAVILHFARLE